MDTQTPLPCPFCGETGVMTRVGSTFRWIVAECIACGATCGEVRVKTTGPGTPAERIEAAYPDAIAAWNARAGA